MMTVVSLAVNARTEDVQTFRTWAPTPPKGWNSWDCYYSSVNEELVLQNAKYMKEHLLEYGWEYVVIDIRWYANHPSLGGGWYNQTNNPDCQLDEYGRYVPSPIRFPSAVKNGKNEGFKALADSIHNMGLKFGIHIMRGVPKYILNDSTRYKLKGAEDTSWSYVYKKKDPECTWLKDNLTVSNNSYGQLYYNSIIELYASWGVDFIKVDDMSRPYYNGEIEMLRRAIDRCGRPIVLSLSPGKTAYDQIDHLHLHANQWRMMDDLWDRWDDVKAVFREADYWSNYHLQGCYADCDMLPLGQIAMTVKDEGYANADAGRKTRLTKNEQYTLMTLWGICHSPLFFGGELTNNDAFTDSLLTNKDYLRMHAFGENARQVSNEGGKIVWTSEDPDNGDRWLALFYTEPGNGWILDQQALYASETVAYTTDGHKVDVEVELPEGTTELALVVDDAGDGLNYDHADWIAPKFIMKDGSEMPITGKDIKYSYTKSYYNIINENKNVTGSDKMSVVGTKYDNGFSMDANAMILLNVPAGAVGFKGIGALDDTGVCQPNSTASVKFYVFNFDPRTVANTAVCGESVSCDLTQFGYDADDTITLYDVWSGEHYKTMHPGNLNVFLYPHSVRLFRITSAK